MFTNNKKRIIMKILPIIMLFTLSSFAETYISGSIITNSVINDGNFNNRASGTIISKDIVTSSFNKIDIDIPADVTINRENSRKISIKTDDNVMDKVKIYVKKDTLFIRTKGSFSSTGINLTINNPHLTALTIDGASTINLQGFNERYFTLTIDGSSDVSFHRGNFDTFSIQADGSYDVNLLKVDIKNAKVKAEGAGEIKIKVSNYLDIDLIDTVEVKYLGNPKIKKSIKDVSDLIKI